MCNTFFHTVIHTVFDRIPAALFETFHTKSFYLLNNSLLTHLHHVSEIIGVRLTSRWFSNCSVIRRSIPLFNVPLLKSATKFVLPSVPVQTISF